jgi:hypothetical protein
LLDYLYADFPKIFMREEDLEFDEDSLELAEEMLNK